MVCMFAASGKVAFSSRGYYLVAIGGSGIIYQYLYLKLIRCLLPSKEFPNDYQMATHFAYRAFCTSDSDSLERGFANVFSVYAHS